MKYFYFRLETPSILNWRAYFSLTTTSYFRFSGRKDGERAVLISLPWLVICIGFEN